LTIIFMCFTTTVEDKTINVTCTKQLYPLPAHKLLFLLNT
jgi:hypothetical protein